MKALKVFAAIAVIAAGIFVLNGCGFKTNYVYKNGDKYTAGDREISDKIEKIDIDYRSGDVKLVGSDTSSVSIKETSNKQLDDKRKVHSWVDGTTLYIRYCASAKKLDLNNLDKKLTVTIPGDVKLSDVKVVVSSGSFGAENFEAENINAESSSGAVSVDCTVKNVKMEASSGSVYLTQKGVGGEISLMASSGSVNADVESADKLSTEVSSGKINVKTGKVNEFKSKASSGSCEFTFDEVPASSNIEASSGDVTIYLPENADISATFKHSSGDLDYSDIAFTKDGNNYVSGNGSNKLSVETSSGDITIKKLSK